VVDDQALAVLAAIDDLRHDLPGSVHDARVALRKLRSTLIVFRPLLHGDAAEELEGELRWLATEMGTARDAQVVRSRITAAVRANNAGESGEVLLRELDNTSTASWDRARDALADPRTDGLIVLLEGVRLRTLVAPGVTDEEPRQRLGDGLRALIGRAAAVVPPPARADDAERLHRLRKRTKRIRFATAALREQAIGILPAGSGTGRLLRTLEDLQDQLGEYQDAVVTAAVLDRLAAIAPDAAARLAGDLAAVQRAGATGIREALPDAIERVRRASRRMQGRLSR
jgi:CHAD domain-containing protein